MSLSVKDIEYGYTSAHLVLKSVNLKIDDNQLVSIVGPNGSGKTTLMKCMNRIYTPSKGRIVLDGLDITQAKPYEIAAKIGYVPQSANGCLSGTVADYIILGRRRFLKWKVEREDIDAAMNAMRRLDIVELANRNYSELSGGQRQKVVVARALVQEPDVFLFDEPISNLDIKNQLEIMKLAREIVDELHKTVIMVVHDLNMAAHFSDKVAIMKDGAIDGYGSPSDVITETTIKRVYDVDVSIRDNQLIDPFVCMRDAVR